MTRPPNEPSPPEGAPPETPPSDPPTSSLHGRPEPGEDERRAELLARMRQAGAPQAEIDRALRDFDGDNRAARLTRMGLLLIVVSLLGFCTFDALA